MISFNNFINDGLSEANSEPISSKDFSDKGKFLDAVSKDPYVRKIVAKIRSFGYNVAPDKFIVSNYGDSTKIKLFDYNFTLGTLGVDDVSVQYHVSQYDTDKQIKMNSNSFKSSRECAIFVKKLENAQKALDFLDSIDVNKLPQFYN